MFRSVRTIALALGLGILIGCGGNTGGGSTAGSHHDALVEIGEMFKSVSEEGRKPPASQNDLGEIDPMIPVASPLIRDGSITVLWGAGYATGSQKIIAYETKTPSNGGYVLLQDGTVKEMTASEFQSAPKVKK
jgi:hypothetical protein